jgi:glycosyltransferase involved in cell wall biosynthesis
MKLAIYNNGIPFHGNSPVEGPLGGSESGIVYMSRELAALGIDVSVYCNCPSPGTYDGVEYIHYHRFFDDYKLLGWDVFIGFRSFDPFLIGRVAPRTIYWTGDAFDQPAIARLGHPLLQENIDLHFCVSEWHRATFIDAFDLPADKVVATRNGFRDDLVRRIEADNPVKNWTNGVYSSTPFRGLEGVLAMFPRLRRRVPGLSLDVYSSMKVYGWDQDNDREAYDPIYRMADQKGVTMHGSVGQEILLNSLARSGFLLYPNTFDETSCISAIEAQACGAVVVTSAKAGLKETVADGETGVCIPGEPRSDEYQRRFIDAVAGLAKNPDRHQMMSAAARKRAFERYSWRAIASEWQSIFDQMEPSEVVPRWTGPLSLLEKAHGYLEKGNRSASLRLLDRLRTQPFFENEIVNLETKLMKSAELESEAEADMPQVVRSGL